MTKILLTAAELQQLLSKHPEVEIELVSTAAAQIAGRLTDKVKEKLPNHLETINKAIERQVQSLASPNGLHSSVKELILAHINAVAASDEIRVIASKGIAEKALLRVDDLIKARMQKVEQEVAGEVAKAAATMRGQIEALAEAVMMKLIRGTLNVRVPDEKEARS